MDLMNLQTANIHSEPIAAAPSELEGARNDSTPIVEAPPEISGKAGVSATPLAPSPSQDSVSVAALALDAARGHREAAPDAVARETFDLLPEDAIQSLAIRAWSGEIRRAMGRLRSGRNAPTSPAWVAVADAHKVGRLDVARWSINGEWINARDLTLEQVGKLSKYYRQQAAAYEERKRRFNALYAVMREGDAKKAGDLGDEKLAAVLFG